MIELSVTQLAIDERNTQAVVILKDQASLRALPIRIGALEARAISAVLEGAKKKRPLTHDLLANVIKNLKYAVKQVQIDELSFGSTYCATIELAPLDQEGGEQECRFIDARPSDAIALAIASGSPIFISDELMAQCAVPSDPGNYEKQTEEFKHFIQNVNASDFKLTGVSVALPEGEPKHGPEQDDAVLDDQNMTSKPDAEGSSPT